MRFFLLLFAFLFFTPLFSQDCEIFDLSVVTGDCNEDGTYQVTIDFEVQNPGNDFFEVWGNNEYIGIFPLSQLPLQIENFHGDNAGPNDVIRVCINDQPNCCRVKEFPAPECDDPAPCEVYDLTVQTGDCHDDGTYSLWVDFEVQNPGADQFTVWANNNQLVGTYALADLPLQIEHFPGDNNGPNDVIKVCITPSNTAGSACCRTLEFPAPECDGPPCEVYDLTVQTGDCHDDGTYTVWVDFEVQNPGAGQFTVWGNNQPLGTFPLSALPLQIEHFPGNNNGPNDVIKVCVTTSNTVASTCCHTLEFPAPECDDPAPCEIFDLSVVTGPCNNDGTYPVTLNFGVQNPGANNFTVYANGQVVGVFALSQLPLLIEHFPGDNNGPNDVVKVCITPSNTAVSACCRTKEFPAPDCNGSGPCEIYNLTVETGPCNNDGTYPVTLNFQVQNPVVNSFTVTTNGQVIGTFNLSQLPLQIEHFPGDNNGPNDALKVCMAPSNTATSVCCRVAEFPAPDCGGQGDCVISNITVETGDCNDDGTYNLWLDFDAANASDDQFDLWANSSTFLGTFNLSDLPLHIEHFPTDGGATDRVKICINDNPGCCKTKNFAPPVCPSDEECRIWKLKVTTTPCVCGQFFALISFRYKNVGGEGFDVLGNNGQNYGNFPYSSTQPIVVGPLAGDNTTDYGFIVQDHAHPDCQEDVHLGKVDCDPERPVAQKIKKPEYAALSLSPNPAIERVQVSIASAASRRIGTATVEIFRADGQLLRTETVSDGSAFTLDVATLAAGVYRVRVVSDSGAFAGDFVKQ